MSGRFLQIHFLTSYSATLLNRDDAGFAKRIPFGGSTRARISSQCLKRHWRVYDGDEALTAIDDNGTGVPMSIRSRRTFEKYVFEPLVQEGVPPAKAEAVTRALLEVLLGEKPKKGGDEGGEAKGKGKGKKAAAAEGAETVNVRTNQVTVLGVPEVELFKAEGRAVCQAIEKPEDARKAVEERFKGDAKKNLAALRLASGLDAALFGRMVTSDILARGDAAVHVAHAFTVHADPFETDYFSALDELQTEEGELGSGHINTAELTSGLYYGYVVVDVPLLVSNLEGCDRKSWQKADRTLAAEVVRRLVHLLSTVSPGAKRGSTAPYSYAHLVLAEAGNAQPRTLANAFLRPVSGKPDLIANAYAVLARHLGALDGMYGRSTQRWLAALGQPEELEPLAGCVDKTASLKELALWSASQVQGG